MPITLADRDVIRRVRFSPYHKGMGPTFALTVWDTHDRDWRGQTKLGYRLTERHRGHGRSIFEGDDFTGSPMDADDSDAPMAALMGFLALRPGDTDAEYFDRYTPEQLAFADAHAEALAAEVRARFGED